MYNCCWLINQLTDSLSCWLTDLLLTDLLICTDLFIDWLTDILSDSLTDWMTDIQLIDKMLQTDWLIIWLALLTEWQAVWLANWLTHCLMAKWLMFCLTDCPLLYCVIDWLNGWPAACKWLPILYWLTNWLADMLSEWLIDSLTNKWLTDWLTCQLTDLLTDWLANLQSGSVTECVTGLLTDWLTCWLADWLTWPADWLIDWLTCWLTYQLIGWLTGSITYLRTVWQKGLINWLRLAYWLIDLTGFLMYCNRIIMLRDGPLEKWLAVGEGGGRFQKSKNKISPGQGGQTPTPRLFPRRATSNSSFCYSWMVCLLGFWLRNALLVKVENPILDDIVFVFHLAWCVRGLHSQERFWPYLIAICFLILISWSRA